MKLKKTEWESMKKIVFPWEGKDTGFTLTEIKAHCNCGSVLVDLRGDIYEAFGVVEMEICGICPVCKHIVYCRSRVYPKKRILAQQLERGWEEVPMTTFKQRWYRETVSCFKPMLFGFLIGNVAFVLFRKEVSDYVFYHIGFELIMALIFSTLIGLLVVKRKK